MQQRTPISLRDATLSVRCTGLDAFRDAPDAAESTVRIIGDWNDVRAELPDGTRMEVASSVSLTGLLDLLDHVDARRCGRPIVGMGPVPVVLDGEEVTLGFRVPLVGTRGEAIDAVEGLVEAVFAQLRAHDIDSRAVADRIGSTIEGGVDVVALHDRLLEG
ncbi:MAG: hypothetical protein ABEJ57_06755 [Halobacteriaceae archaeon]